jgi:hypothetical protein
MTLLVNVIRFYFKFHCYVDLFGFLFGGFYAFISGSEVKLFKLGKHMELWMFIWILGFSSFYLEIFMLFGCLFGFWMFLFFILLQEFAWIM